MPLTLGGMIGQVQKGKLETVFPRGAKSADADLSGAALGQEGVIGILIAWGRVTLTARSEASLLLGTACAPPE